MSRKGKRKEAAHAFERQQRRQRVADLRARGASERDIWLALSGPEDKGGLRNLDTGNPWSLACIHNDLVHLDQEWRQLMAQDTATHKLRVIAEIQAAKKTSWARGQITNVLRGLDQEARLLGLNAPTQVSVEFTLSTQTLAALGILEANGWRREDLIAQFEQFIIDAAAQYQPVVLPREDEPLE